jgi:bisphosphoglycerate-dependent phosphoglycerate mutase
LSTIIRDCYLTFTELSSFIVIRRNSLKARPPPIKRDDPYYAGYDRRYDDLSEEQIPLTESLLDCMERGRWNDDKVYPACVSGRGYITYRFGAIKCIHSSHHLFHTSNDMQCIQARPLWEYSIRNEIKKGNNVLVVAHTNSLRALMRVIDSKYYI